MAEEFNNLNNHEPEDVEKTDAAQGSEKEALSDTQQKGNKKKLIIGIVAAVVVVCAVIAAVAALTGDSGEEKYTDTPVSDPTSELTPGIENGVIIESAPNAAASSEDTQGGSGGSGSSGSSGNTGSSGNAGGKGDSGNAGNNSGDSSNNAGDSGNSGNSGNFGNSGNSGNSGNEEPVARQLDVYIVFPNAGGISDNLFLYINNELVTPADGKEVELNGKVLQFKTTDSYEGVITVEARLENYGVSASQISTVNGTQVTVALPLNGSEENFAPDI